MKSTIPSSVLGLAVRVSLAAAGVLTVDQTNCLYSSSCTTNAVACFTECFKIDIQQVNSLAGCYSNCTEVTASVTCRAACDQGVEQVLGISIGDIYAALPSTGIGSSGKVTTIASTIDGRGSATVISTSATPDSSVVTWHSVATIFISTSAQVIDTASVDSATYSTTTQSSNTTSETSAIKVDDISNEDKSSGAADLSATSILLALALAVTTHHFY